MSTKTDEPDPAELRRILLKNGWKPEEEDGPPAGDPIPVGEGEVISLGKLLREGGDSETIKLVGDLPEGAVLPDKDRVRNLPSGVFGSGEEQAEEKKDPWVRFVPELGKVEVTPADLETYTRALLFDQRFELAIPLWLGDQPMTVVVRSLYISEREVMAFAVAKVAESYPIQTLRNAALVSDYFLKMSVLVQVVSINDADNHPYDARPEPGQLPETCPKVEELANLSRTAFGEMHQAKLKALIRALHTFETKQQILEDAYYNRDFRPPAGAC